MLCPGQEAVLKSLVLVSTLPPPGHSGPWQQLEIFVFPPSGHGLPEKVNLLREQDELLGKQLTRMAKKLTATEAPRNLYTPAVLSLMDEDGFDLPFDSPSATCWQREPECWS